jgi:hypothetical protein
MADKLNSVDPKPRQVWEHFKTEHRVLIISIKGDTALCALMDKGKVSPKRVVVPLEKFKFWSNRGMFMVHERKGKLPTPGKDAGAYNTRNAHLGAR